MGYTNEFLHPLERPYEKIKVRGAGELSDKELLAILLQGGIRGKNNLELASSLLDAEMVKNKISQLLHLEVGDLLEIKGIGTAKAARIVAAVELGKRAVAAKKLGGTIQFNKPELIYNYLADQAWEINENMLMLLLDCHNRLIRKINVAKGDLTQVSFNSRALLRTILRYNAKKVALGHNHPSGDVQPSKADLDSTRRIFLLLSELDIELIDHIVISSETFLSIRREYPRIFTN